MQQILQHYYPKLEEIAPEAIQETRQRLRDHYRTQFPDLDMDPNSVFGDLWLTPAATHIAALDIAITRYKSDLDLANVAEGIIWDCDFVEAYLKNFAPTSDWDLASYGAARLTFNTDAPVILPRNLMFSSNEAQYRVRLAEEGPLYVRSPGTAPTPGVNEVFLTTTNTAWIVDVPLIGSSVEDDPPSQGDFFSASSPVNGLVSAVALHTFDPGSVSLKLSSIAQFTRETVYAATPGTKGGVSSFLRRQFPSYIGSNTTTVGDPVMMRPAGIRPADVYVRSQRTFQDSVSLRLKLESGFFEGEVLLPALPIIFDKVTVPDQPELNLEPYVEMFYKSADAARAPGWSGAYSELQRIWLRVEMPLDPVSSDPLIDTEIVNGDEYAVFSVSYYQDPGFKAAADILTSDDNKPIYVDLLPKTPVVVFINSMVVRYKRKKGTKMRLQHAREELKEYVNGLMHPEVFSDARVADILFFAGAVDVLNISVSADVRYAPAPNLLIDDPDVVGLPAAAGTSTPMPSTTINTTEGLKLLYNPEATAVVSPENARYFLPLNNIVLEEV